MNENNLWLEYERRKRELPDNLSPDEYNEACRKIADDLRI